MARKKKYNKNIIYKNIEYLHTISEYIQDTDLIRSYNKSAYKLSLKHRLKDKFKRNYCKKCFILWIPGKFCEIEINDCFSLKCKCGNIKRYPLYNDKINL